MSNKLTFVLDVFRLGMLSILDLVLLSMLSRNQLQSVRTSNKTHFSWNLARIVELIDYNFSNWLPKPVSAKGNLCGSR